MSDKSSPNSTEPPADLKQPMIDSEVRKLLKWARSRKATCIAAMVATTPHVSADCRERCFEDALVSIGSLAAKADPQVESWGTELIDICVKRLEEIIDQNQGHKHYNESKKRRATEEIQADGGSVRHMQKLQIRTAIRELEPKLRTALELKLSGASYEEIANFLHISPEDAKNRVSRARSIIRDRLA